MSKKKKTLALTNALLIDPESEREELGSLLIRQGRIADIVWGEVPKTSEEVKNIDCRGKALAPGIVDMRVFVGEPGERHKESFRSVGQAAAAGGVTTIATQPSTHPAIDNPAMVEFMLRRALESCVVKVAPMAALTKNLEGACMTEYQFLTDSGAVAFCDADRPVSNAQVLRHCMDYATSIDALVVHHPQETSLSAEASATESALSARLGLCGVPAIAETIMLERDMRLSELTGCRYHADVLSVTSSLAPLRRGKDQGLPVSAAATAAHFSLNESEIIGYRTFGKIAPPLRSEEDRSAIAQAIAEGLIEVIVSSHRPQDEESKRLPFELAANGAIGLETLLSTSLSLARETSMSLAKLFQRLSLAPCKLLRLEGGRLAKGAPADLVIFDPEKKWILDRQQLRSKSKNSPFDGAQLTGKALQTFVAGKCVFNALKGD